MKGILIFMTKYYLYNYNNTKFELLNIKTGKIEQFQKAEIEKMLKEHPRMQIEYISLNQNGMLQVSPNFALKESIKVYECLGTESIAVGITLGASQTISVYKKNGKKIAEFSSIETLDPVHHMFCVHVSYIECYTYGKQDLVILYLEYHDKHHYAEDRGATITRELLYYKDQILADTKWYSDDDGFFENRIPTSQNGNIVSDTIKFAGKMMNL